MSQKRVVRSACRMCHGVCQVLVHLDGDRVVKITGDPESPVSKGYICPKGVASIELLYHPDRLIYPLRRTGKRGENRWERVSWDAALDEITERLSAIKQENGPEYFGMSQGTGRPYMNLAPRFANAFGTPNYTSVGHICYAPRVIASILTLGRLPVCDVYGFGGEKPACVVLWGCNVTYTGASDGMCGGMVEKAMQKSEKLIVIDPRRIPPAEKANHWLQLRPGTDGALALAMINTIISEELVDQDFIENYTVGYEKLVEHVRPFTPEWATSITRLKTKDIRATARTYAAAKPACIQWGNALDMSACNLQTARAILILSAICGNFDRPGGDVHWVPPEQVKQKSPFINPGVFGGRFLPPDKASRRVDRHKYPLSGVTHPPSYWRSIVTGDPYRIRAMWIVGSNPLVTNTHSLEVEQALRLLEFTVVSDFFLTPTAQLADLVLPAATWLEQDDIANLHKIWCVLARKKVAQIGEARDDKEVMIQLANRLGMQEAFPWKDLREYHDWVLEDTGLNFDQFCARGILMGEMRYYKYKQDGFNTPSKKAEIYSSALENMGLSPLPVYREPPISPISTPDVYKEYPLILTTGAKIKTFFHSEGRQIESLRRANPDPLVEIHPDTASSLNVNDNDWVWIETQEGRVQMRARLFDGMAKDLVCAQHAWWFPEDEPPEYGWKKSSVNLLFGDTDYDPDTGSEPLRSALCRVYPVGFKGAD
ncbi:MAG: molybdopterin-dependent oxidoreductase [Deltaproteobacteria bacterium]|nr:molybdopterin-dependent oxidoreductase [Deltaproteobacteria bacterium]